MEQKCSQTSGGACDLDITKCRSAEVTALPSPLRLYRACCQGYGSTSTEGRYMPTNSSEVVNFYQYAHIGLHPKIVTDFNASEMFQIRQTVVPVGTSAGSAHGRRKAKT